MEYICQLLYTFHFDRDKVTVLFEELKVEETEKTEKMNVLAVFFYLTG